MVMICILMLSIIEKYCLMCGPMMAYEKNAKPNCNGIRNIINMPMIWNVRSMISMIQWTMRKIRMAFNKFNMLSMMMNEYIWYWFM